MFSRKNIPWKLASRETAERCACAFRAKGFLCVFQLSWESLQAWNSLIRRCGAWSDLLSERDAATLQAGRGAGGGLGKAAQLSAV